MAGDNAIANAQAWLDQVKADLTQGEVTMFIPDMPNVPPQNMPVMIAEANQAQAATTTRTLGVCHPAPSDMYSLENVIEPIYMSRAYFDVYEHKNVTASGAITILQQPKHGLLRLVTEADRGKLFDSEAGPLKPDAGLYAYLPDQGYDGKDSATILVDFGGGLKVQVKYYFQAVSTGVAENWVETYCSKNGPYWKISSTLDANGNSTITSLEYVSPASGSLTTPSPVIRRVHGSLAQLDAKIADMSGLLISLDVGASADSGIRKKGDRFIYPSIHQPASVTSTNLASLPGPPL